MLKKLGRNIWELLKFTIITLAIVVPIRTYIAQPFIVSGASMYPTFSDREYLIIDELSYHFRPPRRGEVVVFRYPRDPNKHFIKRIVGLPGETVRISNNRLFIEGAGQTFELQEFYAQGNPGSDLVVTLNQDEYFVLGDNRGLSLDSRSFGVLPLKFIAGRAFVRLFPLTKIELLPGEATY